MRRECSATIHGRYGILPHHFYLPVTIGECWLMHVQRGFNGEDLAWASPLGSTHVRGQEARR
jgi:hypothetical protein